MTADRVDVHAHLLPDFYRQTLIAAGLSQPDGIRALPAWDEQAALDSMDALGVRRSILSISSPGVFFGDEQQAGELSRQVNEYAVGLRERHPGRFGFFASVPVPDMSAATDELRGALDHMGAAGLVLETNTAGIYLGDERLEPLYAILSEHRSTLFVHPTTPHAAAHLALGRPRPLLEFLFESTRSITDLVLSGALDRHPGMRVIVPHAGAALPILARRVDLLLPALATETAVEAPHLQAALSRLDFDLAGVPVPELLTALLAVADPERIHYGSDYPFTPAAATLALARELQTTKLFDDVLREKVLGGNAAALFDR